MNSIYLQNLSRKWYIGIVSVYAIGCLLVGYALKRNEFGYLIGLYAFLFGLYLLQIFSITEKSNFQHILWKAILLRLLWLGAIPTLSDDIYRFIWDGKMNLAGISPFAYKPSELNELDSLLFAQLNSPDYYSVYPAVCQLIFTFSVWLFPDNWLGCIVLIRLMLILADTGIMYGIFKLTQNSQKVALYALNPFILIELVGNLHFEGLMICGLIWMYIFLLEQKIIFASICFAGAVSTKLLPLMITPFLLFSLPFFQFISFGVLSGSLTILLHLPLGNWKVWSNMMQSIHLYFFSFEFNASIYYVARWVGFRLYGYNLIQWIGGWFSGFRVLAILSIAWMGRKKWKENFPDIFVFSWLAYLLFASQVHPWYVAPLLGIGILKNWLFPIWWSGVVMLSYSAYQFEQVEENMLLILVEYMVVLLAFVWDVKKNYATN